MPTAGSEAPKNTTPSLAELASVLGSMGFHRGGGGGEGQRKKREDLLGLLRPPMNQ